MIPFNGKIMNIAAIALLCYLAYVELGGATKGKTRSSNEVIASRYKVTIPPSKKHENYNFLERAIYSIYKSKESS